MLEQTEWGEYKLGDLFEIKISKSIDEGKIQLKDKFDFQSSIEFVGRTRENNGIKGYAEEISEILPNQENTISITQVGTITTQLRKNKWYASQNIFVLKPKKDYQKLVSLAGVTLINHTVENTYDGYSNYPTLDKLNKLSIQLPTKNGEIDFDFMEIFIKELESYHIKELESYLQVTGLKNYDLTEQEKIVLRDFENGNLEWKEFKIGGDEGLFKIEHYGKQRSQNDLQREGELIYNFIMQNETNNGFVEKVPEQIGNDFNLIPGNSISAFTHLNKVYYQENPFYSKQGSNIYTLRNEFLNKQRSMFIISTINKRIGTVEYGKNTASRVERYKIYLPVKNGEIDFKFMETFISAIQKLVIKDVVDYAERKINITKKVVN